MKQKMIFFDIDYTLFDTATFKTSGLTHFQLYKEIPDTLSKLSKIAKLAIFSKGENNFQVEKLKRTDVLGFFPDDTRFIYDDKMEFLHILQEHGGEQPFLIDDKLVVLSQAKAVNPTITTVWIKRGPYAEEINHIDGFTPDHTIEDLSQLVEIIGDGGKN
jgi:FMN phosphatase YigB (HAD superfamily)